VTIAQDTVTVADCRFGAALKVTFPHWHFGGEGQKARAILDMASVNNKGRITKFGKLISLRL
jgi:hypothetical protein